MDRITTFVFLLASLIPTALSAQVDDALATTTVDRHEPPPKKITRYVRRLISRYDTDGDGILNSAEWDSMQGQPAAIDLDRDGQISSAELIHHIVEYARTRRLGKPNYSPSESTDPHHHPAHGTNRLSTTTDSSNEPTDKLTRKFPEAPFHVPAKDRLHPLPDWFSQRDQNGDGQLSLAEFSPASSRESVKAFQKLDINRDGLVTPRESVK